MKVLLILLKKQGKLEGGLYPGGLIIECIFLVYRKMGL